MRNRIPLFARRGVTSPFGKLGPVIAQLRLRGDTERLVRDAAARSGLPLAEFVREYLETGFHGRAEVERRQMIRLDVIERVLPKRDGKKSEE